MELPLTAHINLIGPKSLLPNGPLTLNVERSKTWIELFTDMGFPVIPDYVATQEYTPTMPQSGKGRRGELDKTVGEFISGFKFYYLESRKHTVKVCTNYARGLQAPPHENQENGRERGPNENENGEADGMDINDEDYERMYDDAMLSIETNESEEAYELQQDEILPENIRNLVAQRMDQFSNSYKLKVQRELQFLFERRNRWIKFFCIAPLAVKMLEDVFVRP